jgi:hypothetical protein
LFTTKVSRSAFKVVTRFEVEIRYQYCHFRDFRVDCHATKIIVGDPESPFFDFLTVYSSLVVYKDAI